MSMTIEIPDRLAVQLARRAQATDKKPQIVLLEILEKEFKDDDAPKPQTEREKIRAIFKEAGFLSEVSPEMVKRYVKPRSEEEREAMRERLRKLSFSPTFSEMIIEDRGPR